MEVVHDLRKRLKAFTQPKKVSCFVTVSFVFFLFYPFILCFVIYIFAVK